MNTINIYIESGEEPEENRGLIKVREIGNKKTSYAKEVLIRVAGKSRAPELSIRRILPNIINHFKTSLKHVRYISSGGPDGTRTRYPKTTTLEPHHERAHSGNKTHQDYKKCRNYIIGLV